MDQESIYNQILSGHRKAGKHYAFNDDHDPHRPADFWFQHSPEGLILFVVFFTQACRWSRCLGCNLPGRMSSRHVSYKAIMAQIDNLFNQPEIVRQYAAIHKIIVSNNGSILDQATFSSTAFMYLMAKVNLHLPNLAVFALETRPEFVEFAELEFIARALAEGDTPTELELAIGFEAFDEHVRNQFFDKGLSFEGFEKLVRLAAPYNYRIKTYFMQKPVPQMTDAEAVRDIERAIDYLHGMAGRYGIRINMHLNPTYAARGTLLEESFQKGQFTAPLLSDVARAVRHARDKALSVFIGLSDEGLAVEGGSFLRPADAQWVQRLEQFNRTQDYAFLES